MERGAMTIAEWNGPFDIQRRDHAASTAGGSDTPSTPVDDQHQLGQRAGEGRDTLR
jgi:hypothetical protein